MALGDESPDPLPWASMDTQTLSVLKIAPGEEAENIRETVGGGSGSCLCPMI